MPLNDTTPPPIVVVGGGLTGASFALAAASARQPVCVIEAFASGAPGPQGGTAAGGFDARSTAISWGSRKIFESLGVWEALGDAPCPIKQIEVSDQGHLGGVRFDHREHGIEALGYVIENHALAGVLLERVAASKHIELLAPADVVAAKPLPHGMELTIRQDESEAELTAALMVLADGGMSPMARRLGIGRQVKDYGQFALAGNIALAQSHRGTAFERFTASGPLAVLPLPSVDGLARASLVWTLPAESAREYCGLPEAELLPRLQKEFGPGMGRVAGIGRRSCFPLRLIRPSEQARPGLVLLGNAAHTLHPVAGQGFNLALRDCVALAEVLGEAAGKGQPPGDMAVLQGYLDRQAFDQDKTVRLTDMLVGLFSGNSAARASIRRLGLLALDLLPPLRTRFAKNAAGMEVF
ncbi:MAG: 2-octaprenyl-6-methoxyphenyl hydroxylase [Gammaproteobacteria bacterium]|nr:2-octaprenyl-6-methoxyphenyl hydroxylase [Gammaproteobacteria bacterium]